MKITILGLGIIGTAWANNLREDGYDLKLWNRSPKELDGFIGNIHEAVRDAEVIFLVVSDSTAVHQVLEEIRSDLHAGQTVLQCSTITPESVQAAAVKVRSTGADFLDTPFTGSLPAAQQRQTVFFVGGAGEVLARVRPVMERLARAILPIGEIGAASTIKLAMNLNIAEVAQALCESLQLARAGGISDELYFQALQLNVSKSGLAELKKPQLVSGDFSAQFSLKHMLKDLRQARDLAGTLPLPQLGRTIEIYEEGLARGWGEEDFIGLIRLLHSTKAA